MQGCTTRGLSSVFCPQVEINQAIFGSKTTSVFSIVFSFCGFHTSTRFENRGMRIEDRRMRIEVPGLRIEGQVLRIKN